jgi:dTDP-4-dehydrorhamnose 3,5-epimerase
MEIVETPIPGCFLIKNRLFTDKRGYFFESFNHRRFCELTGWQGQFVQDNQSESSYGVIRGLHFQEGAMAQAKLVRVLQGRVLDVALDLRPDSAAFGQVFTAELADDNGHQLFVPRGCAHGFSVLSPKAVFFYKCDNYYDKASERGIHPLDAELAIDWKIDAAAHLLSEKDALQQSLAQYQLAR